MILMQLSLLEYLLLQRQHVFSFMVQILLLTLLFMANPTLIEFQRHISQLIRSMSDENKMPLRNYKKWILSFLERKGIVGQVQMLTDYTLSVGLLAERIKNAKNLQLFLTAWLTVAEVTRSNVVSVPIVISNHTHVPVALSTRMDPEKLKIMGNRVYKSRKFVEALSFYDAAIFLDPESASYRSNTKKNDQQQPKSTYTIVKQTYNATPGNNFVQGTGNQQISSNNNMNSASSLGNRTLYSRNTNTDSTNNKFRRNEPRPETSHLGQQTPENMNVRSVWTGKSLEGSAVTETDPLDMSEEAKAEWWFKRVAQIKDISELSQIPDEDFPSIMPMRKGVNWFVVSKRKTPLERRLTSPQYRKNLRIMSSDPMKREGDNDN
ncbi:zinc finger protein VAR3, chloroplastic-like protein [Tanacetum coccineum]